jgi:hypothetical protein
VPARYAHRQIPPHYCPLSFVSSSLELDGKSYGALRLVRAIVDRLDVPTLAVLSSSQRDLHSSFDQAARVGRVSGSVRHQKKIIPNRIRRIARVSRRAKHAADARAVGIQQRSHVLRGSACTLEQLPVLSPGCCSLPRSIERHEHVADAVEGAKPVLLRIGPSVRDVMKINGYDARIPFADVSVASISVKHVGLPPEGVGDPERDFRMRHLDRAWRAVGLPVTRLRDRVGVQRMARSRRDRLDGNRSALNDNAEVRTWLRGFDAESRPAQARAPERLKPEGAALLEAALMRGEIERGAAPGITGLPERTARRVLNDTVAAGLLASATPKGPVSLRFPEAALETLFPRLFPQT